MKKCNECPEPATHCLESHNGLKSRSYVCWDCLKPYHNYSDQTVRCLSDGKKVNPATCQMCGNSPRNYLWEEKPRKDGGIDFHCRNCGNLIGSYILE
ncbi:hypothetical protein SAMN04487866_12223 [Thermoactinomyces sp. DSM 45891]|nr:hypothetical protein SAMN04487866_12223 [Thermoactinomyces sp. DSM 45891]